MSDKIVSLIQLIDDIRCDIEKSKFKRDFGSMKLQEKLLQRSEREIQKMIQKQGYEYRACVECGNVWNVCKQKHNGMYICPHCVGRRRNETKEKV